MLHEGGGGLRGSRDAAADAHTKRVETMTSMLDRAVATQPDDGITRVRFSSSSEYVLASSWSGSVHVYNVSTGKPRSTTPPTESAALDATFNTDANGKLEVFSARLDGRVLRHSLGVYNDTKYVDVVGMHSSAARCVEMNPQTRLILSSGWDRWLLGWDVRQPGVRAPAAFNAQLPGKAYAMAPLLDYRVAVATSSRSVLVYDLRYTGSPVMQWESLLKHQIRCLAAFPDASCVLSGSIEGRVALERLNGEGSYTFKCHRSDNKIYPVNAIAIHPRHWTFATGGVDGQVNVWDSLAKKRICQYPRYDTSIASLAFSPDGNTLALAVSYTFEEGEKANTVPDELLLRPVADSDVQPKARG